MKKIGKTVSDADVQNFDVSEKVRNMGGDTAYKTKAGRKRHSIQMDRRLSIQMYVDRRSSNASSTGESVDSLCKLLCLVWEVMFCFVIYFLGFVSQ